MQSPGQQLYVPPAVAADRQTSGFAAASTMFTFAQLLSNLRILLSLPPFIIYYLFYSSFPNLDPEGHVTDIKVLCFRCLIRKPLG